MESIKRRLTQKKAAKDKVKVNEKFRFFILESDMNHPGSKQYLSTADQNEKDIMEMLNKKGEIDILDRHRKTDGEVQYAYHVSPPINWTRTTYGGKRKTSTKRKRHSRRRSSRRHSNRRRSSRRHSRKSSRRQSRR